MGKTTILRTVIGIIRPNRLNLFYGIFLGALIPSFVAIFAIFQELKSGTIKTILFSGHPRFKVIISKMVFVSLYIVAVYTVIRVLTVISGVALWF